MRAFLATNASQGDLQRTHAMYGICRLSDDSFLALCSKAVVQTFLATNNLQQDLFVRKVVLLWYCFCCIKKSVSGTAFANGFLVD